VAFVAGRPWYKIVIPGHNVALDFVKCLWEGIRQKFKTGNDKIEVKHWLDRAAPKFGKQFVEDCKALLRVCVIFLCYPLYWACMSMQVSQKTDNATTVLTVTLSRVAGCSKPLKWTVVCGGR